MKKLKFALILLLIVPFLFVFSACEEEEHEVIDLTGMSATVAAGYITQIQQNPSNYVGKVIKMKGLYTETNGRKYVGDSCCNPMLITYGGSAKPKANQTVTIEGEFKQHSQSKSTYFIAVTVMRLS